VHRTGQIIDVVDMMRPLTKSTVQIVSSGNIPTRVREAIRVAEEERPGPTHLELPEDIAKEETSEPLIPASLVRRPIAEDKAIQAAINQIQNSKRPLLLVGAGANRRMTSRMLRRFVETTGIPFITTQMGKGVIDETHPLFMGNAAISSNDFVHRAIEAADLIINVGHDIIEKPPFFMKPNDVQVIHINFFSATVDPVYFPQLEVVGDIANSIWQITERIEKQDDWDFTRFHEVHKALDQHLKQGADDPRFPVYPQRLVADMRRIMPDDGIITLDNGIYKLWFARNYKARLPNTVLLDNALAAMGAGLPSAIAARLIYPDRKIVAVCGDGGFMMNSQELETAVRLNLNLLVVVLRDDAYGMIKWKQKNMQFEDFGLDMGNPDFVQYAQSYGAHGHRVEAADDLIPLMQRCHETHGVHVIDVPVDYSENERILFHEVAELSAKI
jgi:acetolactate synthase-1/2/3 large subunit